MDKELTVEEILQQVEDLVEELEQSSITLEESMKLYRQGVELMVCGKEKLDLVEKEIIELSGQGGLRS